MATAMTLLPVSSPDERLLANQEEDEASLDAPQTSGSKAGESVITQFMGNSKSGDAASVAQLRAKMGELAAAGQADGPQSRIWKSILCCLRPQGDEELKKAGLKKDSGAENRPAPRRVMQPVRRPVRCVLPPLSKSDTGKKCLVLDLDETLVHSSFKPVPNPDFIIPVEIDGRITDVFVLKRPFVDEFLTAMGQKYEVVLFTASLSKYADPLLDLLDPHQTIRHRLFREHCCPYEGNYVKDLSVLGRDLASTIIIDNSPHSYVFHPENAVPISTFIDEPEDCELMDLIPYLNAVADVDDVRLVLAGAQ